MFHIPCVIAFSPQALGQAKQLLYVANKEVRLVHKSMSDWLTDEEASGDLFVEQIPGHEVLAQWCLDNLDDPFSVGHLAYHCCFAGMQKELRELFMSFKWLQKAASGLLARDMDTFYAEDGEEMDSELRVTVAAVRLSERALKFDRKELASQLIGRIRDVKHPIVAQAMEFNHSKGFLVPVTPTLTPADTALRNVLVGHTERIHEMTFSPDSKLLVSGSDDNTVGVWSVDTGELLRTITAHSDWVNGVDFHPEQGLVATASDDGTARVFRVVTGEEIKVLRPLDTTLVSDYTKGRSVSFSKAEGECLLAVGWINGMVDFYRVDDDFSAIGTWNPKREKEDEVGKVKRRVARDEPWENLDHTIPRKGTSLSTLDWSPAMVCVYVCNMYMCSFCICVFVICTE
jgi:WD40 repeat protein